MGRTTPRTSDDGIESILDSEQSRRPSKEAVQAALRRVQNLQPQLVQEQQAMERQPGQDILSMAYTEILARMLDGVQLAYKLAGARPESYTEVAADYLRILGEATQQHTWELEQSMQTETSGPQRYTQMQLDLNARLELAIGEFI